MHNAFAHAYASKLPRTTLVRYTRTNIYTYTHARTLIDTHHTVTVSHIFNPGVRHTARQCYHDNSDEAFHSQWEHAPSLFTRPNYAVRLTII